MVVPPHATHAMVDIAPAIRTRYDDRYSDIERIAEIGSDTRFHRGLGESGSRVLLVRYPDGCPRCSEEEMVLSLSLNPAGHDDAAFYCTNLKCPHFVADEVEYDMSRIRSDTPHTWDNTAECPDCGTRHTVEIERHSRLHTEANEGSSCIVEVPCEACEGQLSEAEA